MEWLIYSTEEPFGDARADQRAGLLASVVYNVNRTKKSQKTLKPSDFFPNLKSKTKKKKPSQGELILALEQAKAIVGLITPN